MLDRKKLYSSLKEGKVQITFESANSGREIVLDTTLNQKLVPDLRDFRQNVELSDTLLVWRLDNQKWEDIRMESITSWQILTK